MSKWAFITLANSGDIRGRNLGEGVTVLTTETKNGVPCSMLLDAEELCEFLADANKYYEKDVRRFHPANQTVALSGVRLVCPICGSDDIQLMHWVEQRTGKVVDDCGDGCHCNACEAAGRDQTGGAGTMGYQKPRVAK